MVSPDIYRTSNIMETKILYLENAHMQKHTCAHVCEHIHRQSHTETHM